MADRILIAEDEDRLREILCDLFVSKGAIPVPAANGAVALELASDRDRRRLEQLFTLRMDHDEEEKIEEVQSIYDRLHVRDAVEQVMLEYDRTAFEALDAVDLPEEKKTHLRIYAELLSGRKK